MLGDGSFACTKNRDHILQLRVKNKEFTEKLKKLVKELEKINGIDPITNKRKITEYHKQRISKANKGRKRLDMIGDLNPAKRPEARIKISKAKKEYWERIRAEKNAKVGNSSDGASKF